MAEKPLGRLFDAGMRQRIFLLLGLLFFAALVSGFSERISDRSASLSPEVHFTDSSHKGLSIVPASCPSNPHFLGDCSPGPQPPPYGGCSLSASPYNIAPGQSATLSWATNQVQGFGTPSGSINPGGIPASGSSGSVNVSPTQTTTYAYTGTVSFWFFTFSSFTCDATITVADQSCPVGYVMQNGQCVLSACPAGYTLQNGQCVISSCPAGYTLQNGQCVNQCGAQFFCQGNDLYKHDANCNASLYQHCVNGCSGGACVSAGPSIVLWKVSPILVKSGTPVNVEWQAKNVSACTITGTNGDSWSCTGGECNADTTKQSKPIIAQTIYTITCQGFPGALPSSVTQSTTVNIIPVFHEQ